jgi:hypothetical protein
MKFSHFLYALVLIVFMGCASDRRPSSEDINNVQAYEQEEERYIYGADAFVREGSP